LNLFQIEVLVKVAETGNFTKAGDMLGLTQSGVSHNVSALETELGIQLLYRGRSGVTLTDAGMRIIGHMRSMLADSEHIKQQTAAIVGMEIGKIKVGSFPSVSAKLLPKILTAFKGRHKGIELELHEGKYNDILEWIANGVVDIGFVILPVYSGMEFIPLMEDRLVVVIPADHPLCNERFLSVEQIAEEPFIMPKAGCEALVTERFQSAGLKPNVHFEVEDNPTILSLVQEGLGVTIVPRLTLPTGYSGAPVAELVPEAHRRIGLAVKSLKDSTPATKAFIKVAEQLVLE
jgi:DNA-binding transcriptional LysR family regulator